MLRVALLIVRLMPLPLNCHNIHQELSLSYNISSVVKFLASGTIDVKLGIVGTQSEFRVADRFSKF